MDDQRATQLQETGFMPLAGLTIAEVLEILDALGISLDEALIRMGGNLAIKRTSQVGQAAHLTGQE